MFISVRISVYVVVSVRITEKQLQVNVTMGGESDDVDSRLFFLMIALCLGLNRMLVVFEDADNNLSNKAEKAELFHGKKEKNTRTERLQLWVYLKNFMRPALGSSQGNKLR